MKLIKYVHYIYSKSAFIIVIYRMYSISSVSFPQLYFVPDYTYVSIYWYLHIFSNTLKDMDVQNVNEHWNLSNFTFIIN